MFQNLNRGTILADHQIRALCTPPQFMVKERVPGSHAANTTTSPWVHLTPVVVERLSHLSESELRAKKFAQDMRLPGIATDEERLGILNWRPATEAEIAASGFKPMIEPFFPAQVKMRTVKDKHRADNGQEYTIEREEKIVSYGLSSAGYDVRLDRKFKIFTNIRSALIDPLNMSADCYVDHEGDDVIIPPHSYILGHTPEVFDVPRDVMIVCVGKSTYARAGCAVNVTPIEPGFKGQVVIEIANQTPLPMKVYADMGIAQFLFFKMSEPCETSYSDRKGKYQDQRGITTARV